MNTNAAWATIFSIAFCFATDRAPAAAEKNIDFTAEQAQIEKEDAEQQAEREKGIKGKYQRVFQGTLHLLPQTNEEISPDVVGYFVTSDRDKKPRRNYQVKLARDSQALMDALKKMNRKSVRATGVLRCLDANGEAKYLILDSISEEGGTQRVPERRSASGL